MNAESEDLVSIEKSEEEVTAIVNRFHDNAVKECEALQNKMSEIAKEINNMDISKEKKSLIMYRWLCSLHSGMIGYHLSIDSAVSVTKKILDGFQVSKSFLEHDKLIKIDNL
ncbi:MAG: hypothetical protein K9N07_10325 [Candidatus Cloacimonetes bacterium]|nr:hypothetical protein [Candidatus Cloacimonadota bacterium]MCF8014063.1 hypothetical protein [Candidatus Woesearchaeota archaeon]